MCYPLSRYKLLRIQMSKVVNNVCERLSRVGKIKMSKKENVELITSRETQTRTCREYSSSFRLSSALIVASFLWKLLYSKTLTGDWICTPRSHKLNFLTTSATLVDHHKFNGVQTFQCLQPDFNFTQLRCFQFLRKTFTVLSCLVSNICSINKQLTNAPQLTSVQFQQQNEH